MQNNKIVPIIVSIIVVLVAGGIAIGQNISRGSRYSASQNTTPTLSTDAQNVNTLPTSATNVGSVTNTVNQTSTERGDDDGDDDYRSGSNTSSNNTITNSNSSTGNTTNTSTAKTYTLADVAKHNSSASCWTAINGGVYDVTAWIDQHPGGPDTITSLCGIDGSATFDAQHGGQSRPENELATFKIGNLTK